MKKLIYLCMGLVLCMGMALLTGCDKNNEPVSGTSGGSDEVVRGSVEGVVKDASADTVIPQALVELLPADKMTETDGKGAFSFTDLKKGTYRVRVSKEGYETYTSDSLKVTTGVKLVLSVGLTATKPAEPEPADPAEVIKALEASMVYVEGGTFSMGATSEQGSDYDSDELPVHSVTLDGFYIGAFEVTQAQWYAVMGTTIEQQRDKTNEQYGTSYRLWGVGDNYPMYYVSWNEAVEFCEKLSAQTGKTYRLPTEAEWEYAARGGNKADGTKYAGSNNIDEVAWFNYYDDGTTGNSNSTTHPVGRKKANGLGIYDMSGNVWEWCSDWYGSDYYGSSSAVNPQGPTSGSCRVIRGGGWNIDAWLCRVSIRFSNDPDSHFDSFIGFRVVCER